MHGRTRDLIFWGFRREGARQIFEKIRGHFDDNPNLTTNKMFILSKNFAVIRECPRLFGYFANLTLKNCVLFHVSNGLFTILQKDIRLRKNDMSFCAINLHISLLFALLVHCSFILN